MVNLVDKERNLTLNISDKQLSKSRLRKLPKKNKISESGRNHAELCEML